MGSNWFWLVSSRLEILRHTWRQHLSGEWGGGGGAERQFGRGERAGWRRREERHWGIAPFYISLFFVCQQTGGAIRHLVERGAGIVCDWICCCMKYIGCICAVRITSNVRLQGIVFFSIFFFFWFSENYFCGKFSSLCILYRKDFGGWVFRTSVWGSWVYMTLWLHLDSEFINREANPFYEVVYT